jgi:branched-chain amino acid transport system ATP-binding protein
MPDILAIENLHYYYGAVYALKGISIGVRPGEIVALLGSNGAGKTTTLRCISGLLGRVAQGRILFKDAEIQHKPAEKIAAGGISHVLEGRHIFSKLTVKENLILGAFGGKSDARARLE